MDLDLGPLGVLICWQSLLLSFCVATATHGVKTVLDFNIKGGKEERRKKVFINRIVLPATPIVLGSLVAVFVPLHPEALLTYFTDHAIVGGKQIAILIAYGSCLGQFSDYVWHRFSGLTADVKKKQEVAKEETEARVEDNIKHSPPPAP
jgi:hypothetical protein